jgi:hypothetical protein
MSDQSLGVYLRDHLAGAAAAVEILALLREQHAGEPLGEFAATLRGEIEADRAILVDLAEHAVGGSSVVKEATAWLSAKVGRIKLGRDGPLGTLEALETVALGVLGKLALWRALLLVAPGDPRLDGVDFGRLATRAESQHEQLEERRLEAARVALGPDPD